MESVGSFRATAEVPQIRGHPLSPQSIRPGLLSGPYVRTSESAKPGGVVTAEAGFTTKRESEGPTRRKKQSNSERWGSRPGTS